MRNSKQPVKKDGELESGALNLKPMGLSRTILSTLLLSAGSAVTWALAPPGPWDAFNYAPTTRTVYATSIRHVEPTVSGSENLLSTTGSATLNGQGAWVTLDFGKEVRMHVMLISHLTFSCLGRWTCFYELRWGQRHLVHLSGIHRVAHVHKSSPFG